MLIESVVSLPTSKYEQYDSERFTMHPHAMDYQAKETANANDAISAATLLRTTDAPDGFNPQQW